MWGGCWGRCGDADACVLFIFDLLTDEPGIGNAFESADNRAAFSGSFNGHARGA